MTDPLRFVPPRVAFVDPRTGMITREWYLFLQGVFMRVGGANGSSTPDIVASLSEDAGSSETNALIFAIEQATNQIPPDSVIPVDPIQTEISELREIVAELKKDLEAIRQGTSL